MLYYLIKCACMAIWGSMMNFDYGNEVYGIDQRLAHRHQEVQNLPASNTAVLARDWLQGITCAYSLTSGSVRAIFR